MSVVLAAALASAVTTVIHEVRTRLHARQMRRSGCPEHRWTYFSLYRAGEHWNRACGWCHKHETRWSEPGVPSNWPPAGARVSRGEAKPDLDRRPKEPR